MFHNLTRVIREIAFKRSFAHKSNILPASDRSTFPSNLILLSPANYYKSSSSLLLIRLNNNYLAKSGLNCLTRSFHGRPTNLHQTQANLQHLEGKYFHTSRPCLASPLLALILRPLAKFGAFILGRSFRKWYQSLPPNKKELFKQWLKRNYVKFLFILSGFAGLGLAFYESHLQETPITKRKRFILFTEKQFSNLADMEFQITLATYQDKLFPANHPVCRRIERVAMRILNSNQDLKQIFTKKWTVTVVNAPDVKNAFVTPNGQIFVFSGILNLCQNDDQLAAILAHEMAHSILGHAAELLSYTSLIDFFLILVIALIWAALPSDALALAAHALIGSITDLALQKPYNRKLEAEADEAGLIMAAKACFDVREFVAFWKRMSLYENLELGLPPEIDAIKNVEFISTHPAHSNRAEKLEAILDEALHLRDSCKCPKLSRIDPRLLLEREKELYLSRIQQEKLKNLIILDVKSPNIIK